MASHGVWWEFTSNWHAVCPVCKATYNQADIPCVNCRKAELVYFREIQETRYTTGPEQYSKVSLRCLHEGINIHGFFCSNGGCKAAIPMGCIKAFLTVRFHFRRPLLGLLAGVTAAVPFLMLPARIFGESISENAKMNWVLAAITVGVATYFWVARYVRLYYGRKWMTFSNE